MRNCSIAAARNVSPAASDDLQAFAGKFGGEFADGRRLPRAVDADDEDRRTAAGSRRSRAGGRAAPAPFDFRSENVLHLLGADILVVAALADGLGNPQRRTAPRSARISTSSRSCSVSASSLRLVNMSAMPPPIDCDERESPWRSRVHQLGFAIGSATASAGCGAGAATGSSCGRASSVGSGVAAGASSGAAISSRAGTTGTSASLRPRSRSKSERFGFAPGLSSSANMHPISRERDAKKWQRFFAQIPLLFLRIDRVVCG